MTTMNKEDLKTGKELQSRIKTIGGNIQIIKGNYYDTMDEEKKKLVNYIDILVNGSVNKARIERDDSYSDKANTNLEYLNQLYRDNVLRTLEDCKKELEKEFELLGK